MPLPFYLVLGLLVGGAARILWRQYCLMPRYEQPIDRLNRDLRPRIYVVSATEQKRWPA